ncbi:TonB-dependent receptor [Soonwooa sp.]|uniref:TonB-dependent receptor domain-containing protein n=1 Tax=Soonwooa sp. TaxID=1938592 RepID=UPI002614A647|nr:TonB-dependent receptor [Soonwooa sp.]
MIKTEIRNIIQKRTLGLVFVLGAASLAFAQQQQQPSATQQKFSMTGSVQDNTSSGIGYASLTFKNKQNAQLSDAVLANVDGNFKIELAAGSYEVTIEAIDFKTKIQTIQITKSGVIPAFVIQGNEVANLDKTTQIQGVVITAAAPKAYKVELDKKTYDPSQDIVSKGGSLQDVLTNVPSVSVDTDGTVSMRGNSNVKFLINGKPSSLLGIDDGANALQSIPADQIEKIEVITNPSSKFEASGTAGILNIILKKNKKTGFNGSVVGSLGYLPQTNLNANLSWRKGKFSWFLNGGGGYRESENKNKNTNSYINVTDPNAILFTGQNSLTKSKNDMYNATGGLVYDISDKTSMNISGTVRTFDSNNNGNIDYNNNFLNGSIFYKNRSSLGNNNNLAFQGDWGLDHKFNDKGHNISLSVSVQRNRSNNDSNILETTNNVFSLNNVVNQKTVNKTFIGKADYELPIGEKSKLEAGYRIDINRNDYDNDVLQSTAGDPVLRHLKDYTYQAQYEEMFNAFYLQFKSKIDKFGYQLGVRDEYSNISLKYHNLNPNKAAIDSKKNYNNLFPSVYLSYDIAKDNQLLLNYSRRIDRPRSFFLIPNPSYADNQNIFDGNIDLDPAYVDSYELGYNLSKKKFTITPTLYYRHESDDVKMLVYNVKEYVGTPDETIVFHTKPINLGVDDRYGLDFNFTYDAFSWLKFMGSADVYKYYTKGQIEYNTLDNNGDPTVALADFTGKGFSTRLRLNSTFKIDKTFSVQLQGFYRGAQKTAYQDRKDMYAVNLGASKTIWNGNGTIAFNIQDIFNTRAMESTTYTANATRYSYMQWQPRQFNLSLTYRFKQGEKVDQPKRKKDINSNASGDDQQGPM